MLMGTVRAMNQPPRFPGLIVRPIETPSELLRARRLHARCYVEADYVGIDDLSVDGLIEDPWVPYSDYYIAIDVATDEIVGTARIIRPSIKGFPAAEHSVLYPQVMDAFATLDPNLCMEISALATTSRKGLQNAAISTALYAKLAERAVQDRRAFVFAVMDSRLLRTMRRALGINFEQIGLGMPERSYWTTPTAVYLPETINQFRRKQPELLQLLAGGMSFADLADLEIDLRERAPRSFTVDAGNSSYMQPNATALNS
jgi:hypothetical protein